LKIAHAEFHANRMMREPGGWRWVVTGGVAPP